SILSRSVNSTEFFNPLADSDLISFLYVSRAQRLYSVDLGLKSISINCSEGVNRDSGKMFFFLGVLVRSSSVSICLNNSIALRARKSYIEGKKRRESFPVSIISE